MSHVATVTIDNTQVTADLTDFVVYIDLSDLPSSFWDVVTNGGGDIRVYKDDDTTELAREVVSCDTATDTGELHVKFTGTLSSSVDTDIHIYADGTSTEPAVTATYGRNAVWSDYKVVLHLDEDPTGTIIDSTGNHSVAMFGSMTSGVEVAGKLGNGLVFDGSNDFLEIGTTGDFDYAAGDDVMWSAWADYDGNNNSSGSLFGYEGTAGENRFLRHKYANTGNVQYEIRNNSAQTEASNSDTDPTTGLNHIVFWRDVSTAPAIYINGASNYTIANSINGNALSGLSNEFVVGAAVVRANVPASAAFLFGGIIDEVRVLYNKGDANWITTEYNNQNSPSTFYTATAVSAPITDVKNSSLATNLVSYWELEEASGTRVDSHGSNDLTDNNTV